MSSPDDFDTGLEDQRELPRPDMLSIYRVSVMRASYIVSRQ